MPFWGSQDRQPNTFVTLHETLIMHGYTVEDHLGILPCQACEPHNLKSRRLLTQETQILKCTLTTELLGIQHFTLDSPEAQQIPSSATTCANMARLFLGSIPDWLSIAMSRIGHQREANWHRRITWLDLPEKEKCALCIGLHQWMENT